VLAEYAAIAFSDITQIVGIEQGEVVVRNLDELPPAVRRSIASIEQTANGAIKVRLHNKVQALDSLAKHLGLFDADNQQKRQIVNIILGAWANANNRGKTNNDQRRIDIPTPAIRSANDGDES
jgi:hypothetical protein